MDAADSQSASSSRSNALDALRALAILGMGLSGRLPWGTLPAWMYHAQMPPPEMKLNPQSFGITWVDLVFPFFLFSMGAAMPFAMAKRASTRAVIQDAVRRGLLLALFAIAVQNFRPESLSGVSRIGQWTLGGVLFFAMVLAWGRWPVNWSSPLRWTLTGLGVGGCLAGVFLLPGWNWQRLDIILLVLANVAVSGGLAWWFTRTSKTNRTFIAVFVGAAFLAKSSPGPVQQIWTWQGGAPFFLFEFQKYLPSVLIGTLAGEWARDAQREEATHSSVLDRVVIASLGPVLSAAMCFGLLGRDLVWTWVAAIVLSAIGVLALMSAPIGWQKLGRAGIALVMLGLVLEPLGGGIRKDPTTLSYLVLTAGLACWTLLSLMSLERAKILKPLAMVGANPMIAYIAITNLVPWIVRDSGLHGWVGGQSWGPWGFAGYGLFQTFLVAIVAYVCTRVKVFMRS